MCVYWMSLDLWTLFFIPYCHAYNNWCISPFLGKYFFQSARVFSLLSVFNILSFAGLPLNLFDAHKKFPQNGVYLLIWSLSCLRLFLSVFFTSFFSFSISLYFHFSIYFLSALSHFSLPADPPFFLRILHSPGCIFIIDRSSCTLRQKRRLQSG